MFDDSNDVNAFIGKRIYVKTSGGTLHFGALQASFGKSGKAKARFVGEQCVLDARQHVFLPLKRLIYTGEKERRLTLLQ